MFLARNTKKTGEYANREGPGREPETWERLRFEKRIRGHYPGSRKKAGEPTPPAFPP